MDHPVNEQAINQYGRYPLEKTDIIEDKKVLKSPENKKSHFILDFSGYSMYPFLRPGDRIIVKSVSRRLLKVGDIVVLRSPRDHFVVHRLVKILPNGKGVLKGDSLLAIDPEPIALSTLSGIVTGILREDRLIPVSTGFRSRIKALYAFLSLRCLTTGAIRLRVKNLLTGLFTSDQSYTLKEEKRFIMSALLGLQPEVNKDLDWAGLLQIAFEEGVAGIVYRYIRDKDIPGSLIAPMERAYHAVVALNLMQTAALDELMKALDHERIELLTLKGASLMDNVYRDLGTRPMGDIDLMVRPEDHEQLINLLYSLGYERDKTITHLFIKDGISVDLHIHALNIDRIAGRKSLFLAGMEPIWKKSVPWKPDSGWLRRPDDTDNIILSSQHLMKHSFSRLIWLFDIYNLLKNRDVGFWAGLSKRADQLLQRRSLFYTLYLLNGLFSISPPKGSGLEDVSKGLNRLERGILGLRIRGQSIDRMGPLMAFFCVKGTMSRIAFLWETLFPGKKVVEEEFGKHHGGKRFLFYASRAAQAAILLCRRFSLIMGALIRGV